MPTKRITLELPAMDNPALTREQRLETALREALRIAEAANGTISDGSATERRKKRIAELWKVLEER